ncbi:hypothetical protein CEXT_346041 [Caerostris extrusa]|uniref:Uncharacterized protein n=1 Tax=Caerostris extrusa TaxID=172846 RepID=A0AAV4SZK6_CAEEX|nr:hypothetical protein CEXT_346041 [Caerostris extrusa]
MFDEVRGLRRLVISQKSTKKNNSFGLRIDYAEVLMILQNRHSELMEKSCLVHEQKIKARSIACNSLFIYYLTFSLFLPPSRKPFLSPWLESTKNNNSNNKRESKLFPYTIRHNSKRWEEVKKKKATENGRTFFRQSLCLQRNIPSFLLTVISGRVGKGRCKEMVGWGGGILR